MTYNQLCEIIQEIADTNSIVSRKSRLTSDLGLCSFDMMVLLSRLEDKINHSIDVTTISQDMTIEQLYEMIKFSEE